MFIAKETGHFSLGRIALFVGILATVTTAVAVIRMKRKAAIQGVEYGGWEDGFGV